MSRVPQRITSSPGMKMCSKCAVITNVEKLYRHPLRDYRPRACYCMDCWTVLEIRYRSQQTQHEADLQAANPVPSLLDSFATESQ